MYDPQAPRFFNYPWFLHRVYFPVDSDVFGLSGLHRVSVLFTAFYRSASMGYLNPLSQIPFDII